MFQIAGWVGLAECPSPVKKNEAWPGAPLGGKLYNSLGRFCAYVKRVKRFFDTLLYVKNG